MDAYVASTEDQLDDDQTDTDKLELLQLRRNENDDESFGDDILASPSSRVPSAWTPKISVSSPVSQETERLRSIRVLYVTSLITSFGWAIVIFSLWPYIYVLDPTQTPRFVGWIYFACAGSFMFGIAVFISWLRFSDAKFPLIVSTIFLFTSGALHLYAQAITHLSTKVVLMARCFCAIATASNIVYYLTINQVTFIQERQPVLIKLLSAQAVGYIAGPALQELMTFTGERGVLWHKQSLHINLYTSPGLLIMVLAAVNLILIIAWFKQHNLEENTNHNEGRYLTNRERRRKRLKQAKTSTETPDYRAIVPCLFAFFCLHLIRTFGETMTTVLAIDHIHWSRVTAVRIGALIQIVWGSIWLVTIWTGKRIASRIGERKLLIAGIVVLFAVTLILVPYGHGDQSHLTGSRNSTLPCGYNQCHGKPEITRLQFFLGFILLPFGHFPAHIVLISLYEKVTRPLSKGTSLALWLSIESFAQLVGPLALTTLYVQFNLRASVLCLAAFPIVSIIVLLLNYRRLIPYHVYVISKHTNDSLEILDM